MANPTAVPKEKRHIKNPILVRERRLELVNAAVEVFFQKGFHGCRVADVAEAAGFSQGTVYNYVKSKEDLLYMVCEDHLQAYDTIVKTALDGANSSAEKFDALLHATIEAMLSYRKHYVVMLRELHHVEKTRRSAFLALASEQRKICEDALLKIAKDQGLRIGNPLLFSNLLIFLPTLLISRGWDFRHKVTDKETTEFLISFVKRGVCSA
jgi:AcrR family transcriptional regulator